MERWVNIIENNCDPDREDEYNDWYNNIHIPDVLASPGYVRARRYVHREFRDGRGKYMALYEIETDDIDKTMKIRAERRAQEHGRGRTSANRPNLAFPLWRDVLFKWLNFVEQNCDPTREAEYHDWYNNMHIPDILLTPSFVSARRYEIKDFRDGRGKYLAIYEIETDDIDNTMKIRLDKRAEEVKLGRASASRNNLSRAVWRDMLWKQIGDQRAQQ
jgi:predicted Fe-Mo cluster-binding NifX family protein